MTDIEKITIRWRKLKEELLETQTKVERIENITDSGMTSLVKRNFVAIAERLKSITKVSEDNLILIRKQEQTIQQLQADMGLLKQELTVIKARTYGSGATS